MDIKPMLEAAKGVQLALAKFETVMQNANDANIFAVNTQAPVAAVNTQAPVVPMTPATPTTDELMDLSSDAPVPLTPSTPASTPASELDDEGVPHDVRIHSESKSLVNSKDVRGGKAWRRRKGIDDATYDAVKSEIKQSIPSGPAALGSPASMDTPSTVATPSLPGLPGAPSTPSAPSIPTGPATPSVDESAAIRKECIGVIKQLTDVHGLTFEDCKEILVEEFKVAQNGEEITFGAIKIAQYEDVLEYFVTLRGKYEKAETFVSGIREIAGPANAATIDTGLASILTGYNTEELGGVHYSQIDGLNQTLEQWHKQYVDWKASQ